jgi:(p)ppGpp synthase/HD superfamily hydrolase
MMRLSTNISQNLSLQLSTSLALDKGLKEAHDIVKDHEKEITTPGFIRDIRSFLIRANRKGFFRVRQENETLLKSNISLLERAIIYAAKRHQGEYRDSGHPYLSHVLSTGFVLARLGLPRDVILAGILHDVVEDTPDKIKALNDLYTMSPAIAWYVYSVSGPDIKDSVEKDKLLYKRLDSTSFNTGSLFPKAIKCADGIANMFDVEFLKAKDGRTGPERKKLYIENTRNKIVPYAREIDQSNIIPLKKRNEVFSLEEYILEVIEDKEISDILRHI